VRAAVALILLVVTLGAVAAGCGSDDSLDELPSVLFVQTAEGGGFSGDGQDATLTLRPVSTVTTVFTDRPNRDSGALRTSEFVSRFDGAFADDPPNATVSSLERSPGEFILELSQPSYDEATRTPHLRRAAARRPGELGPARAPWPRERVHRRRGDRCHHQVYGERFVSVAGEGPAAGSLRRRAPRCSG